MKHPLETLTTAAGILLMAFLSCLLLPAPALGLGLALCKSIITAHGGEITVADHAPHGTVFTFTIPIEEVELHE